MYQMAKTAREKMKAKARSLAGEKDQKVDSSDWTPAKPLNASVKTGARPIMKPSSKGIGESNAARDTKAAIGNPTRGAFKSGGAVKDAGIKDKKALGAIDPSPSRAPAAHYKKGGSVKKAGGGSALERLVGKPKTGSDMSQVGKMGTANYTQEDKGALNRAIEGNDALPAAGEAAERSGKYQNYKHGGKAKHPDEAADRSLVKKMVKKSSLTGKKDGGGKWIQSAIEKPGALRKSLGVKEGEKIPAKKLHAAAEKGGKLGKRARLAETLGRMNRATGGPAFDIAGLKGGKKASKKGAKTDINIVINAGHKAPMRHPAAGMMPPGADAGLPPMPPVGAGAPPPAMPMGAPPAPPMGAGPGLPPGLPGRKAGGRITKVASSYKDMEAGSTSGEGRLQKTDIAKKHHDAPARKAGGRISKVAKSYKDMTAGAGSGEGRFQKEDIAKAKMGRAK